MKPSREWFDDLVEQTHDGLARYVGHILSSSDDTQEVIQEAYLKVFMALRASGPDGNFPVALLYKTARNIAISRIRHQTVVSRSQAGVAIAEGLRTEGSTVEQQVSASERRNSLLLVVNQLPPKCREVFVQRWIHGLSQRDIAEKLGIAVSTVEKHLAKGLQHCKVSLREPEPNTSCDADEQSADEQSLEAAS